MYFTRQYRLGHSQSPWPCICSKGGWTPKILSHRSFSAPRLHSVFPFDNYLLSRPYKEKVSYPNGHWILVCFHKDFIQPYFWETKLLNILCKHFINSHFCLILRNFNINDPTDPGLHGRKEKFIGGMESNPAIHKDTALGATFKILSWTFILFTMASLSHYLWTFKSHWNQSLLDFSNLAFSKCVLQEPVRRCSVKKKKKVPVVRYFLKILNSFWGIHEHMKGSLKFCSIGT